MITVHIRTVDHLPTVNAGEILLSLNKQIKVLCISEHDRMVASWVSIAELISLFYFSCDLQSPQKAP